MASSIVRVPGGGNTYMGIKIGGEKEHNIEFLAEINDQPGQAEGRATPIHPIGSPYPVEIATPYAQGMGTLTLTVWSRWGEDGWVSALMHYGDAKTDDHTIGKWGDFVSAHNSMGKGYPCDLREVLEAQRDSKGEISVYKYELGGDGKAIRKKEYVGAVITNIDAGDTVNVGTMEQRTRITINYCYVLVTRADVH